MNLQNLSLFKQKQNLMMMLTTTILNLYLVGNDLYHRGRESSHNLAGCLQF